VFLGNPEYGCELQPIDFAAFAHACGGTSVTIVDPYEPPMPATVIAEQLTHFV